MDLFQNSPSLTATETVARLQLIRTSSVGPITFRHLIAQFGSAAAAVKYAPDFAKRGGRKKPLFIPSKNTIENELSALERMGAQVLHAGYQPYPARLSVLEDAPPVLFALGHTSHLSRDSIGIVGARNASAAGINITKRMAKDLSDNSITVVSGLARGIDTAAHQASLPGGTIACIAGGLDVIYPRENDALHHAIAEQGIIVSEMPLGTKPQARHFPRRNRLISGISLGVLVIEAAEKSGSLITARFAAEQGREVFAIPGNPLDPRARGANRLIKDGATLVQDASDIIDELSYLRQKQVREDEELPLFNLQPHPVEDSDLNDKKRRTITDLLGPTPTQIDEIIRLSGEPTHVVIAIILELELAEKAQRYPGGRVARIF